MHEYAQSVTERTPTLTERRKAATQLELAHVAARLFTAHGAQGTTAEAIAAQGGVSLRTFYRYFRTKEDAVAPLLTVGADAWRAHLADVPTGTPLHPAVEDAIRATLSEADAEGLALVRGLLRATTDDPDLAAVWYRVNRESEADLLPVLARVATEADALTLRLVAAAATDAIRIAFEVWSEGVETEAPAELAVRCFRGLSSG